MSAQSITSRALAQVHTAQQSIDSTLERIKKLQADFDAANPGALFIRGGEIVCSAPRCAGMSLNGAIITSRPGQKNFTSDFGDAQLMTPEEVEDWKQFCAKLPVTENKLCECGRIKIED